MHTVSIKNTLKRIAAILTAALLALSCAAFADDAQSFFDGPDYPAWRSAYYEKAQLSSAYAGSTADFTRAFMRLLLAEGSGTDVCSPLNAYVAFSLLAEITGGETQRQILGMLGAPDIETLRERTAALLAGNLSRAPHMKSVPANSLWISQDAGCDPETVERLVELYGAEAFVGDPASKEMTEALRRWTNDSTDGLLREYADDMSLDGDTVLAIVSTLLYKASWSEEFYKSQNTTEIFHGTDGDRQAEMMHRTDRMHVARTDAFTSVSLSLTDSGSMVFFLPDEGKAVESLLEDPDVLGSVYGEGPDASYPLVELSVPKFRVSGKADLKLALRELGVTDAFDPSLADYSPLTGEGGISVTSAEHAATVEIDEDGVTGAALTIIVNAGAAAPTEPVRIVLDRPFLFLVLGLDGSVLFAGIVRNAE